VGRHSLCLQNTELAVTALLRTNCHSNMLRSVPSSYATALSRKYLLTGAVGLYWFNKHSASGATRPRASHL